MRVKSSSMRRQAATAIHGRFPQRSFPWAAFEVVRHLIEEHLFLVKGMFGCLSNTRWGTHVLLPLRLWLRRHYLNHERHEFP